MNAISFLKRNTTKYPNKVGFILEDTPYTYGQVMSVSIRLANYLRENGIGRGDKVCVLFYNSIEQIYAYFSVLMVGAVVVPINFRFVGSEISYIAANSDARAIIYGEEFQEVIGQIRDQLPNVKFSMNLNQGEVDRIATLAPTVEEIRTLEEMSLGIHDDAFILYTSGTTGKPKGAVITHSNMVWNQTRIITSPPLHRDEVMINPLPFFHSGSLGRFLAIMLVGGTIISWKKFEVYRILEGITKYKGTFIILVPAMARMLFELPHIKMHDVSSVRNVLLTAATVPVPLKKEALGVFRNAQILDGYGLTENTSAVTLLSGKDVFEKPSSVGLPDFLTEVRIVNADLKELPANEIGEISVRGPNVMKEYYKDPEGTAEAIKDGWLMTGDLGRKDEDGYLYVVGRKKEMIISGGENIYPAEVEAILDSHPKVQESAVIGVPDSKWGETVMAFLVLKPGQKMAEGEVKEFCVSRMARYKRPRIITIVDSLIKNAAGKTMKHELKKIKGMENGKK
jgi:acyl-CoA synthetase (AMP-forming)/AMP-acid ligase II